MDVKYDPKRAGYDQPNDQPVYTGAPAGQAYAFGSQPTTAVIVPRPRETNWTLPAILATLFCFFPTGIGAIIAAVYARSAHDSGDYNGERTATKWAKGLTITSIVLGILTVVVVVVLFVTVISVASKEQHDLYNGLSRIDDGLSSIDDSLSSMGDSI